MARFGVRACVLCGGVRCSLVFQGRKSRKKRKSRSDIMETVKTPRGNPLLPLYRGGLHARMGGQRQMAGVVHERVRDSV